ncbi:hypothetical protein [Actinomadura rifamycini]|uniref:hypothetical protein n=1 Tax=Actinomadura rifamycini TaxID=31962 RepID=UPI000422AC3C|nr:hypothetical protein [Actinomadura rifamycini]
MAPGRKDVNPERIDKHGADLSATVIPKIDNAGKMLSESGVYDLEGGDFSIICLHASVAYPLAVQFAFEDLKAQKRVAESYVERLSKTAATYGTAEEKNKLKRS